MRTLSTRRRVLAVVTAALSLLLSTPLLHGTPVSAGRAMRPADEEPGYRFAAAPDFLNQDVGDVRRQRGWDPGDPNSWTPRLERAADAVLDEIAAWGPETLLVPGDLVQGHWAGDRMDTGIFGPTRTRRQREAYLERAGRFYHAQNVRRFRSHGLTVHAAVGDHDIGDNPWRAPGSAHAGEVRFKRHHLGTFRDLFADAYTRMPNGAPRYRDRPVGSEWEDTAYAVQLAPEVLLVSLDEFDGSRTDVRPDVVGAQLAWLERVLADARAAGTRWIVVQGHLPILRPVRSRSSSALHLVGGASSRLWQTMAAGGVDVYLCGEVHDTTMVQQDGIIQISTGGLLYTGHATYLTADVFDDRMELAVQGFAGVRPFPPEAIWQGSRMTTNGNVSYPSPSQTVGTLTLAEDGTVSDTTGKLVDYR